MMIKPHGAPPAFNTDAAQKSACACESMRCLHPLASYAYFCSTVYIVADIVTGILPYWVRGWTSFEYLVCMLIKVSNSSAFSDWDQVLQ